MDQPTELFVEARWYYARDGHQRGPVTWAHLKDLAETGQLQPTDSLLAPGERSWQVARSVPDLFTTAEATFPTAGPNVAPRQAETGFPQLPFGLGTEINHEIDRADGPPPVNVPGYVIQEVLGRGGMGVVYKAFQVGLNRTVALKMILAGEHANEDDLARFRSEAEAVARLRHPNVVQIYEIGEHKGAPFFSLEYVEGGNLAQQLNGLPQPARRSAALVETLARAVHAAHEKGIVHRDLKPANVLLAPRRAPKGGVSDVLVSGAPVEDFIPKITDFGLAKQLDSNKGQTQSGTVMGTPSYMAPEQATGRLREISPRTDVYALGAILYDLLTGRPPFRGESPMDVIMRVVSDEPVPPSRLVRVPLDLQVICLKCLEKDPRKRYASANALADELHRYLSNEPIAARPAGWRERCWKWTRRRPAVAALLLVSVAALGMVVAGGLYFAIQLGMERSNALRDKNQADQDRASAEKNESEARRQERRADEGEATARQQIELARRTAFTGQVWRVAGLWKRDPIQAQGLLEDDRVFPPGPRDFAWGYFHRQTQRWQQRSFVAHAASLSLMALSPDGKTLATGGYDRQARLWPLDSLQPRSLVHPEAVLSVAFSRDGSWLATGCYDQQVRIWEVASGKPLVSLTGHSGRVTSVAFSPDGKWLVSASGKIYPPPYRDGDPSNRDRDGEVRLWNLATLKQERVLTPTQEGAVVSVAFSPDSQMVATGISHGSYVRLLKVPSGEKIDEFLNGPGWVFSVAFSPDGQTLAWATSQPLVHLRNVAAKSTRLTLSGHADQVKTVAWTPDGGRVVSGSDHLRFWDPSTGKETLTLRHDAGVRCVVFSPDGQTVYTGTTHGKVWIWRHPRPERQTFTSDSGIHAVALSPDATLLAAASRTRTVQLWDLNSRAERSLDLKTGQATSIAFAGDKGLLAVGIQDSDPANQKSLATGACQLWDTATGTLQTTIASPAAITCVALTTDQRTLILGDRAGNLRLCPVANPREIALLGTHSGPITALTVSPDTGALASASRTEIKLWDVARRTSLGALGSDHKDVRGLAFLNNGSTLAALAGKVSLWDVHTGGLTRELPEQQGRVLALGGDGQSLALACQDRTVKLLDPATGQLRAVLPGHSREVAAVLFSGDGRFLVSASSSEVKVWEGLGDVAQAYRSQASQCSGREELVGHVRQDPTLREPVRKQVLALAESGLDDEGFVRDWLVLAPFPVLPGERPEAALTREQLPNEDAIQPRAGDRHKIGEREWVWKQAWARNYFLDFNRVLGVPTHRSIGYAVCYVVSDREQQAMQMRIGFDDQCRVYLDGKLVFYQYAGHPVARDQALVRNVTLKKGKNVVVFKVFNDAGDWAACLRLTDQGGTVVRNLQVSLTPD